METSTLRKRMPVSALFDPKIVVPAIGSAFVKLDPRTLMKNPVMFVLEVVTALTTVILIRDLIIGGEHIGSSAPSGIRFLVTVEHIRQKGPVHPLRRTAEGRGGHRSEAEIGQTPGDLVPDHRGLPM